MTNRGPVLGQATASRSDSQPIAEGLRKWARGAYPEEAAVELLVQSFGGRLAQMNQPWIRECESPGWFWLDVEKLADHAVGLPLEEQQVIAIIEALVTGGPLVAFCARLQGIGRAQLGPVLAALVHAGGPHDHVWLTVDLDSFPEDCSDLMPWPQPPWVTDPARFDTTATVTGGH